MYVYTHIYNYKYTHLKTHVIGIQAVQIAVGSRTFEKLALYIQKTYTYTYCMTHIRIYILVCIHTYIMIHTHTSKRTPSTCIHTCMHTHIYKYIYTHLKTHAIGIQAVHIDVGSRTFVHVYIVHDTYTYIYTCMYTHTYIIIYIHTSNRTPSAFRPSRLRLAVARWKNLHYTFKKHTRIHICRTHIRIYILVCIHTCIMIHTHTSKRTPSTYIYTCMYTYIYNYIYTHIYIITHTNTSKRTPSAFRPSRLPLAVGRSKNLYSKFAIPSDAIFITASHVFEFGRLCGCGRVCVCVGGGGQIVLEVLRTFRLYLYHYRPCV